MAHTYELKASARDRAGKGSARALRREGKIPAVIYGDKQPPLSISIDAKETSKRLHAGGFLTHVATIDVDGQQIRVLPRDYQLDVVRDTLIHVDFLRVSASSKLTVEVPVHFLNQEASPGLKRGGVLNIVRHEVELEVSPDAIPEHLEVDLTGAEIGDSIHISAVKLPEGARTVTRDRDFTIATIAGSAASTSEESKG
ncbi:50S ribosomal protein L25/general stress protein Ctc [Oharaeibacter diazotrophicus]|uniref:Large ribosomal subunit protein bL25 n=1 Tax=Oharaeibacter diazotrophicus TaxID=1920512 RepID=A0A4R6R980_9HYPH|nr:50S ribosomal protein L25/general stress protein Ctc [Oharaeibacter diazotrophicus]TDP82611.1 large subunit ribosomal protein L25 [Oharaeibacter diazotrophicus]BBE72625.1 50S ribosomal protein L25 [Pleomorphomonas sp. SM30]GLS76659.1 50S ribosomal protein L25 [Oharaeibacter diazotrophicus]